MEENESPLSVEGVRQFKSIFIGQLIMRNDADKTNRLFRSFYSSMKSRKSF